MRDAEETTDEVGQPRWDLSFSFLEARGTRKLGADVRLDLAPRTTVLVGKDGAGKSRLLRTLLGGLRCATIGVQSGVIDPAYFGCEVEARPLAPAGDPFKVRYECRFRLGEGPPEDRDAYALLFPNDLNEPDEELVEVEESCWIAGAEERLLWRVADRIVTVVDGGSAALPAGRTLLDWTRRKPRASTLVIPAIAFALRDLFNATWWVDPVISRRGQRQIALEQEEQSARYPGAIHPRTDRQKLRIGFLQSGLVHCHERDRASFDDFVARARRIGLLDEVTLQYHPDPRGPDAIYPLSYTSALFDGTEIRLLPDQTLQIAQILRNLGGSRAKLLLFEAPDSEVHPDLLAKLLVEIDACSLDRQIALSTQSPQVVRWADPRALRLVECHAGRTAVRRLREDESTLGDFDYAGVVDG